MSVGEALTIRRTDRLMERLAIGLRDVLSRDSGFEETRRFGAVFGPRKPSE